MKWLEGYRIRLVLVGFVAAIVLGGSANADFTFGTPTNLGLPVNSTAHEYGASISADGLSVYFASDRPGGSGWWDIWVMTRPTKDDPWGEPVNLGPTVNSSDGEGKPSISADGLELFFESPRSGGQGGWDIWVTTRPTKDDPWGEPVNLGPPVNSSAGEGKPNISADGLLLYFCSNQPGGYGDIDIWVTTRATTDDDWSTPVNLGPTVNSSYTDNGPSIPADGLTLYFDSSRPGGYGGADIWVTTRATTEDEWGTPVNLGTPVNSSYVEGNPGISSDGLLLYFCDWQNPRPGGVGQTDQWQVQVLPVVDFNPTFAVRR